MINLIKYKDKSYKDFSSSLIKNENIIGIRVPNLKSIAKELYKNKDYSIFDKKLEYHEEYMLYMLLLSHIKDINYLYEKLDLFVPRIKNWAVCDALMNIKQIKKNRDYFYNLILKYKNSHNEFEVRFCAVMLLSHYMDIAYIDKVFNIIEELDTKLYYASMGVSWLLCECFIKFRDYTIKRLPNLKVDNITFNKAISKIKDSYRVSIEDKEYLTTLIRK